jgi:hypothetical protein
MRTAKVLVLLALALYFLRPSVARAQVAPPSDQVFFFYPQSGINHVFNLSSASTTGGWTEIDATQKAGAPLPVSSSPMTGFAIDTVDYVFYVGPNQHVDVLYYVEGSNWTYVDLTTLTGAPTVSGGSGFASLVNSAQGHMYYIGSDLHVHEIFWRSGGQWLTNDLTTSSAAPNATSNGSLTAFTINSEELVYYLSANGHVQELYSTNDSSSWVNVDVTTAAGAPEGASGSAIAGFSNGLQAHVHYFDASNNHLYQLYSNGGSPWTATDLTTSSGAAAASTVTSLQGFVYGSSYRLYYLIANSGASDVQELYATTNTNTWHSDDPTQLAGGSSRASNGSALRAYGFPPNASALVYYTWSEAAYLVQLTGTVVSNSESQLSWAASDVTPTATGSPLTGYYWATELQ